MRIFLFSLKSPPECTFKDSRIEKSFQQTRSHEEISSVYARARLIYRLADSTSWYRPIIDISVMAYVLCNMKLCFRDVYSPQTEVYCVSALVSFSVKLWNILPQLYICVTSLITIFQGSFQKVLYISWCINILIDSLPYIDIGLKNPVSVRVQYLHILHILTRTFEFMICYLFNFHFQHGFTYTTNMPCLQLPACWSLIMVPASPPCTAGPSVSCWSGLFSRCRPSPAKKPPWACQISKGREMCGLWKGYAHPASGRRDAPLFPGMSHILSEAR